MVQSVGGWCFYFFSYFFGFALSFLDCIDNLIRYDSKSNDLFL